MDSIQDILKQKDFDAPPEVTAIKDYIRKTYKAEVTVTADKRGFVVSAASSSLIGSIRLNLPKLQAAADTKKPIRLRIG